MDIFRFVKLILSRFHYLVIIPVLLGGIVYVVTKSIPPHYSSASTIYTGITSNTGIVVDVFRVDNAAAQNEYNNVLSMLRSSSLHEEVALRLLTQHLMLDKPQREIMSQEAFAELARYAPDSVRQLVVKGDFEQTYKNLKAKIIQEEKNYIYRLLHYGHRFYSIQAISKMKTERLTNSDLIRISYESSDPGICFNTVKFATEIIIEYYGELKISQTNSAVEYFEAQLEEAQDRLREAEQSLLEYNVEHDIVNYFEQTKQLTTQQEELELMLQETKMAYEASIEILRKLEDEVSQRFRINLRNNEIMSLRDKLVSVNNMITLIESGQSDFNPGQLERIQQQRADIENRMQAKLDSINMAENNSQMMEAQYLLAQWLDAVKENERYAAQYKSLQERLEEFMLQYKRYAPVGATIKRFEREIDVYERQYLNILQQLGMARQNEQNMNMRMNMRVFDAAAFPINPIYAPFKMYTLAAALFSLLFVLLAVIVIELLDKRIKSPSKLARISGLEVISGFSLENGNRKVLTGALNEKAALLITEKIKLLAQNPDRPLIVQVTANWDNSGTTEVALNVARALKKQGHEAVVLAFDAAEGDDLQNDTKKMAGKQLTNYKSYHELIRDLSVKADYVIFLETPVSNGIEYPILYSSADVNLMVFDAGAFWSDADDYMLLNLKKLYPGTIYAVLNKALPDNLEEIYGEIPKQRSRLRKAAKKFLKQFV
ncbi:MAG: hypothetical protein PHE04_02435 [Bacteroidales bacterium]|nr:hypothetical protein [Bacteroidales bacterium]MDD3432113.1 hypothetical protein [Bacteroidales bacterium]MDD4361652.1 hypothetical protein [Bacteroidales bacterium]MDD4430275.1 hypothetical protein [Bacteroidales bacterium]